MDSGECVEPIWSYEDAKDGKQPKVITFYSFKGGMGRTTALAATAMLLARHEWHVLMIDTDVEAPGLAALFFDETQILRGTVDFYLETTANGGTAPDLSRYLRQISDPNLTEGMTGSLYMIPAGSLDNDLYQSQLLSFTDSSKLSNCIINLVWNTTSLYRLLIKRIANAGSPEAVAYLNQIPQLIRSDPDPMLGYIPTEKKDKIQKFVEMLLGIYMGNSPKQGRSYSWVPNHLQDANGALSPRSFLKCFSIAAQGMVEQPEEQEKLRDPQLISLTRIQGALIAVSDDRVKELQEEYSWLEELKGPFSGLTLLMDQKQKGGLRRPTE